MSAQTLTVRWPEGASSPGRINAKDGSFRIVFDTEPYDAEVAAALAFRTRGKLLQLTIEELGDDGTGRGEESA